MSCRERYGQVVWTHDWAGATPVSDEEAVARIKDVTPAVDASDLVKA